MNTKEAIVYSIAWISMGTMFSVAVVACSQYNTTVDVREAEIKADQWNGVREDCQKHGGIMVSSWGVWNCEVGK